MSVCCIPVDSPLGEWFRGTYFSSKTFVEELSLEDMLWKDRPGIESNTHFKQIIPYILVKNAQGDFACYRRGGAERRLHNFWSCGVGGHIDDCDKRKTVIDTIKAGVMRELSEEFADFDSTKCVLSMIGTIHEDETSVGLHHIGLVFLLEQQRGNAFMPAEELVDCVWLPLSEVNKRNLEIWTQLALQLEETVCHTH
ncbi:NUDIX domain-containing protein [Sphaerochaeta sp. S2]|uniref:NUDIX domain-containing protein n=1 Tax=Sphaerochaeta sp. S2 TaxID=2798868 RepID=UPI0018EA0300|nr:NUDIX domain-containing protein [Sphaerochaeta sp. S2]MBJ2355642.1 NUDIX domain-containing protein [Sphaerochaeta sp. S2]